MLRPRRSAIAFVIGGALASGCFEESQNVGDSTATATTTATTAEDTSGSATTSTTSSTSATSTDTSTTSETSDGTSTTTTTAGTSTGVVPCGADMHEPNDTPAQATDLGAIGDFDGDGDTVLGFVQSGDIDWFTYQGSDDFAMVDPTRELTAGGSVTLCKYAVCLVGLTETTVLCPEPAVDVVMDDGAPGCCASEGFPMGIACTGTDDSADIFFSVETEDDACVNYSVAYHF